MNTETDIDYIWGVPAQKQVRSVWTEVDRHRRNPRSIKEALKAFLTGQIQTWKPDLIIVIERKGTAVLRALIEDHQPLEWNWDKVISSKVIKEAGRRRLSGKRILVFDDMMKRGVHLEELLTDLKTLGVDVASPTHLRVAVFAVHEDSARGKLVHDTVIPHAWYRRGLTTDDYIGVRSEIVEMLQHSGSLMLDTEHLEIRVNVTGSFDNFVNALRRTGNAVVFTSAGSRVNITVLYDDDEVHVLPVDELPHGVVTKSIVKKCRIVQRSGTEFAIIPICFPAVPVSTSWKCSKDIKMLLGRSFMLKKADIPRFYAVGLRSALRVLRWVLKDLYAVAPRDFSVSLPGNPGDVRPGTGYHLAHLRAVYPRLDLDYLNKWIAKIAHSARSEAADLKARRSAPPVVLTADELRDRATALLQKLSEKLDRKRIEYFWRNGVIPDQHPFGLTAAEIFDLASRFGWEKAVISTLFDVLIDEATLVTHVQSVGDLGGIQTTQRTFEPDGEVVTETIRRFTMQWGLPDGPAS